MDASAEIRTRAPRFLAAVLLLAGMGACGGDGGGGTGPIVPTQLRFSVQPASAAAGTALTPSVRVEVRDADGNRVSGATHSVTIALAANPGGATLSGTRTASAVDGVATFADLSLEKSSAGYTLTATATGLTAATSAAFSITAGSATQLAFTVAPASSAAGAAFNPTIQVTARDAFANTAAGFTGNVTIAIGTNPAGGTLSGTVSVNAVNGIATFAGLSIAKAASGYTFTATATGLTAVTSGAFDIAPAAPSVLVFTAQPSNATSGAVISPAITVTARDAHANTVTSYTGNVSVAFGTNPAGGTLAGTKIVSAVAGVATFATLSVDKSGSGYTLAASATGVTGVTSAAFNISAASASVLAFTTEPGASTAGASISPAVVVAARDASGNTVASFTGNVTIAIAANAAGGVLAGTATVAALAGVATFSTLSIAKAGSGYTLAATATGLTAATSAAFQINAGAATQLAITRQPPNTTAGDTITAGVQVTARDAFGNTATSYTGGVDIVLGTNPVSATLRGILSTMAVSGIAEFATLSIEKAADGYTLVASGGILTGATSASFSVAADPASTLAFTVQPSASVAGDALSPAVAVTARDQYGNTATSFVGDITMAFGTNAGAGTLSGTKVVAAVAGVASFSTLSINRSAAGYTLSATANGASSATSTTFTIAHGTARHLSFATQPQNTIRNAPLNLGGAVQVTIRDSLGNTATGAANNVTIAIGTNPGSATLVGTAVLTPVNGVATLGSDLELTAAGTGYTITAAASGLNGATSSTFDVAAHGSASATAFTVQPTTAIVGAAISPAVAVAIVDAHGNTVSTGPNATGTVTVSANGNPSPRLLGTLSVAAIGGVATFSNIKVGDVNTGYRLGASAPSGSGGVSAAFNVTSGGTLLATVNFPVNDVIVTGSTLVFEDSLGIATMPVAGGAITRIASDMGSMTGIVTDGTSVWWPSSTGSGIRIMRVAIGGGAVDTITTGLSFGTPPMVLNATHLFYAAAGSVRRLLKTATTFTDDPIYGTSTSNTGGSLGALALEAGGTDIVFGSAGELRRAAAAGGGGVTVITSDISNTALTQSGATLYYASLNSCCTHAVRSVPAAGGTSAEQIGLPTTASALSSDGTNIYVWSGFGLLKVPIGTGTYLTMDSNGAGRVAIDATHVYWLRTGATTTEVYRAPK